MGEIREHPYATIVVAALFLGIVFFFSMIGGILFYWFGWTDSIFELPVWVMGAVVLGTIFGLVAAGVDWLIGVNEE